MTLLLWCMSCEQILLACIWQFGPDTEGVFRCSPNVKSAREMKELLDSSMTSSSFPVDIPLHVATHLLKVFNYNQQSLSTIILSIVHGIDGWYDYNNRVGRCGVVGSTLAFDPYMGHGFESEYRIFSHHSASAFSKLRSLRSAHCTIQFVDCCSSLS